MSDWTRIPFKKQTLNAGEAYDLDSGVFKAPLTGVYHFDLHACNNSTGPHWVAIANATDMAIKVQGGKSGFGDGLKIIFTHVSANMYLPAGQEIVAVYKGNISSVPHEAASDPLGLRGTQISGFLVFPVDEE